MNALQLFRDRQLGYIEIARELGLDLIHGKNAEAEVEKIIHRLRQAERTANYQRDYRAANQDKIIDHRKRHNAMTRARLRQIKGQHA